MVITLLANQDLTPMLLRGPCCTSKAWGPLRTALTPTYVSYATAAMISMELNFKVTVVANRRREEISGSNFNGSNIQNSS